jgi:hypothetical protein
MFNTFKIGSDKSRRPFPISAYAEIHYEFITLNGENFITGACYIFMNDTWQHGNLSGTMCRVWDYNDGIIDFCTGLLYKSLAKQYKQKGKGTPYFMDKNIYGREFRKVSNPKPWKHKYATKDEDVVHTDQWTFNLKPSYYSVRGTGSGERR